MANEDSPLVIKMVFYAKTRKVAVTLGDGTDDVFHGPDNYAVAQRAAANISSIAARDMQLSSDSGFSTLFIVLPTVIVETLEE
jgi:hypothetical protein